MFNLEREKELRGFLRLKLEETIVFYLESIQSQIYFYLS